MSITVKKMGKLEVCTPFPHFLKKSLHFLHGSGGVPLLLAVFSRNSTAKCIKFAPCYDPSMMTRQGNGWRPRGFPIQVGQHDSCCIDLKLLKSHEISWNAGSIFRDSVWFQIRQEIFVGPICSGIWGSFWTLSEGNLESSKKKLIISEKTYVTTKVERTSVRYGWKSYPKWCMQNNPSHEVIKSPVCNQQFPPGWRQGLE